jgi:uncharacterized membrane protein YphA (DoxX/SURF4 family)
MPGWAAMPARSLKTHKKSYIMESNATLQLSEGTRFAFMHRFKNGFIKYTPVISAYLLAALFLYASWYKLKDYYGFVIQLLNSPLTHKYAHTLAWLVPGLEIALAILLIVPRTRLIGLYGSFVLMFAFTGFVYLVLSRDELHSCGCGGIISTFNWRQHLWFNMFFTFLPALAVFALSLRKNHSPTS